MISGLDMRTYRSDAGDTVVAGSCTEPSGSVSRVCSARPAADVAAAPSRSVELDWIRRYAIDTTRGNAGG
jgi:hypothetical protein